MEIMVTAHAKEDAIILRKVEVGDLTSDGLLEFAKSFMPIDWVWDDEMQLVCYLGDYEHYMLCSAYE